MTFQELIIRPETPADYEKVFHLTSAAFRNMEFSDGSEGEIIKKLRNTESYIPELSFIAEYESEIIGHILLTKNKIIDGNKEAESLTLGPMSVLPVYQKMGIGKKLVIEGLSAAEKMGYKSVIVLGHAEYYPKFGFRPASFYNIKCPFAVPDNVFMALELVPGALKNVKGTVQYPPEFMPE